MFGESRITLRKSIANEKTFLLYWGWYNPFLSWLSRFVGL